MPRSPNFVPPPLLIPRDTGLRSPSGVPKRDAFSVHLLHDDLYRAAFWKLKEWQKTAYANPFSYDNMPGFPMFGAFRHPTDEETQTPAFLNFKSREECPLVFKDDDTGTSAQNSDWYRAQDTLRNQPVALAVALPYGQGDPIELVDVITDPDHQSEGFGSELLRGIAAARRGAVEVILHGNNAPGIVFLERNGFEPGKREGLSVRYIKTIEGT